MNDYEILLMLDVELPEERASEIIARVRERVETDGGRWDGHEPWGRRKLAYEIDHKTDGIYHLLLFAALPATLAEVSRVLKITDGVMRLSPAQLSALLEGLDWSRVHMRRVRAPQATQ